MSQFEQLKNRNGIVVAVLDPTSSEIMTFGNAKTDQLFEIGSITKTFTANLLAQAVLSESMKVSDPIPAPYQKPGAVISFKNLATHTSGLDDNEVLKNYVSPNALFPFEGLTVSIFKGLYAKAALTNSPGTTWLYSNTAVSLMGMILSEKAGVPYEQMVRETILKPLGMSDTYFELPETESARFPTGFLLGEKGTRSSVPHWDLYPTAISPAGGLRSSIHDLIIYARANLTPESTTLKKPIALAQQPLYSIKEGQSMGMNWFIEEDSGVRWHHGITIGFNSVLAFSAARHQAVIALTDTVVQEKDGNGNVVVSPALQDISVKCLQ